MKLFCSDFVQFSCSSDVLLIRRAEKQPFLFCSFFDSLYSCFGSARNRISGGCYVPVAAVLLWCIITCVIRRHSLIFFNRMIGIVFFVINFHVLPLLSGRQLFHIFSPNLVSHLKKKPLFIFLLNSLIYMQCQNWRYLHWISIIFYKTNPIFFVLKCPCN